MNESIDTYVELKTMQERSLTAFHQGVDFHSHQTGLLLGRVQLRSSDADFSRCSSSGRCRGGGNGQGDVDVEDPLVPDLAVVGAPPHCDAQF